MIIVKKRIFHPAIFIPLLLLVFVIVVTLAKVFLWPVVKQRQAAQHKQSALEHLEKGNFRNAFIEIQKAILKNPEDIESYQIALTATENSKDHFQYVPAYLSKLMEVDSQNATHFLKYILLTLKVGAIADAEAAFKNYPVASRDSPEYHQLGYSIGAGLKDATMADHHLSELIKLRPEDQKLQFLRSTLRLRSTEDEELKTTAQDSLEKFSSTPEGKIPALRVLLMHSLVEEDAEQIGKYIEELGAIQDIQTTDRLLILQAHKFVDSSNFEAEIEEFLRLPIEKPTDILLTLDFLLKNQLAKEASDWLDSLPDDVKNTAAVSRKASQVYYRTKELEKLKNHILDKNWGSDDYGRLLLLAYTSKIAGDQNAFKKYWKECLIKIGTNREALKSLLETTATWGWTKERIEVLEISFREEPENDEIFQLLVNHFMTTGDTDGAIQTLTRRVDFNSTDLGSKNNLALLSFLSGKNQHQAFNYASENFNQDNKNPYYATTWAFALTIRNRTEDALKIVENLSEEQKNDPQRAVYLAKIFYAAGKKTEATELLGRIDESALFSEEKFLLNGLRESIQEDNQ